MAGEREYIVQGLAGSTVVIKSLDAECEIAPTLTDNYQTGPA